jgi:hypothetical protein
MPQSIEMYGRQLGIKGMVYAPTTEQGVVFLFGLLAKRLKFCVELIRPQFPDCIATYRGRRRHIEFEMWASSFEAHGHDAAKADMVICWENDWESRSQKYRHIEVVSLKDYVDAEPRVFAVGCRELNFDQLAASRLEWNVPKSSQKGDLLLMYRSAPTSAICDLWQVVGGHQRFKPNNRQNRWPGIQAEIRRIAVLPEPVTYAHLSAHAKTRNLAIVQMRFRGKSDTTEDWPALYDRIVALNPSVRRALRNYSPD